MKYASRKAQGLIGELVRKTEDVEQHSNLGSYILSNHRTKQSDARQKLESYIANLEAQAKLYRKLPAEVKAMI